MNVTERIGVLGSYGINHNLRCQSYLSCAYTN